VHLSPARRKGEESGGSATFDAERRGSHQYIPKSLLCCSRSVLHQFFSGKQQHSLVVPHVVRVVSQAPPTVTAAAAAAAAEKSVRSRRCRSPGMSKNVRRFCRFIYRCQSASSASLISAFYRH
jgi:hypothetical protein